MAEREIRLRGCGLSGLTQGEHIELRQAVLGAAQNLDVTWVRVDGTRAVAIAPSGRIGPAVFPGTSPGAPEPGSPQWRARAMRRFRLERGWSLTQVGVRIGLNASQISRAENGLRRPMTIPVICGVFEVTEAEAVTACPACGYVPRPGWACLRCGTAPGTREEGAPDD